MGTAGRRRRRSAAAARCSRSCSWRRAPSSTHASRATATSTRISRPAASSPCRREHPDRLRRRQDVRAMRAHAWKLWGGLTAPSRSTWNGQDLPVFETWYSATEVFEDRYRDRARRDRGRCVPHARGPEAVSPHAIGGRDRRRRRDVVRKLNGSAATFVWDNGYYLKSTLDGLQQRSDATNTRPGGAPDQAVSPTGRRAEARLLAHQGRREPHSSAGSRPCLLGSGLPSPADGRSPMHLTWARCVAMIPMDATQGLPQDRRLQRNAGAPRFVESEVIGLDRFYTYRLRDRRKLPRRGCSCSDFPTARTSRSAW